MNRSIMNQDIHRPAFIRANVPNDQREQPQVAYAASHSSRINWVGVIKLLFLLGILFGGLSLLSKVITPQVITALAILIGFVVLRFIAEYRSKVLVKQADMWLIERVLRDFTHKVAKKSVLLLYRSKVLVKPMEFPVMMVSLGILIVQI